MDKTPLAPGQLEELVRSTFERAGIKDITPATPAELFIAVAKWDGLLNPVELTGLRMLVRQLSPLDLEFGE